MGFRRNTVTKDTGIVKNENSIKQSIRNLILTQKGERLMQPNLGMNIRQFLFEQITEDITIQIENDIVDTFSTWLPFVDLREINKQESPAIKSSAPEIQDEEPISESDNDEPVED